MDDKEARQEPPATEEPKRQEPPQPSDPTTRMLEAIMRIGMPKAETEE